MSRDSDDLGIPSIGPEALFGSSAKEASPRKSFVPVEAGIPIVSTEVLKTARTVGDLSPQPAGDSLTIPEPEESYDIGRTESPIPDAEDVEDGFADMGPDEDAHAVRLSKSITPYRIAEILSDTFGIEWLLWEPETLYREIKEELKSVPQAVTRDKIQAVKLCLLSDSPWREWDIFEKVCLAFNNVEPNFKVVQDVSPAQATFAIRQMQAIRAEPRLEEDALKYVAYRIHRGGLIVAPEGLESVEPVMDELLIFPGKSTAEREQIREWKDEIRWLWRGLKNKTVKRQLDENVVDIQLARVSAIEDYVKMMNRTVKTESSDESS